jgi:mono/diheme cytochrome c family protein
MLRPVPMTDREKVAVAETLWRTGRRSNRPNHNSDAFARALSEDDVCEVRDYVREAVERAARRQAQGY